VSSLEGNNLVAFYNINIHLKSDLTGVWPYKRLSSLEGNNSVAFYYINIHLKCGPISGVSSLEGNNSVAFYNINTHLKSDLTGVWPYKRGVLS
jgi:hypothetical protein